jgi:hypothetical protein
MLELIFLNLHTDDGVVWSRSVAVVCVQPRALDGTALTSATAVVALRAEM